MHNHILRTPKKKKPPIQHKPLTALFLEKLHTFKKKKKKPRISVKFQDHRKVSVYEYIYRERERERDVYTWPERLR